MKRHVVDLTEEDDAPPLKRPTVNNSTGSTTSKTTGYCNPTPFFMSRINSDVYHPHLLSLQDIFSGFPTEAIVFNYSMDPEWLITEVPILSTIRTHLVMHCPMGNPQNIPSLVGLNLYRAPYNYHYSCHHTKMMILFYEGIGCRVVVHTNNMIAVDWGNKCQVIWTQDFPIKTSHGISEFETSLVDYLRQMREQCKVNGEIRKEQCNLDFVSTKDSLHAVCVNWIADLAKYDFSNAKAKLVPSVPGRHNMPTVKYGHLRVRDLITWTPVIDEAIPFCQFSSIG